MTAPALRAGARSTARHASREEYFAWLERFKPGYVRRPGPNRSSPAATSTTGSSSTGLTWRTGSPSRCWPAWTWHGRYVPRPGKRNGPSYEAGPYLDLPVAGPRHADWMPATC